MTATSQGRFAGPDCRTATQTPRVTFPKTNFTLPVGADLRRLRAFEREFYTACRREVAKTAARELANTPHADSETRLEGALREFSEPVVRAIVHQVNEGTYAATVAEVFTCGKEVMNSGDEAIRRAKEEIHSRTTGTVAA